ncbi:hypothetical protein [Alicyclobacillus sp. SO9]|uniref:hypothetical protein n=1 Tax=Alicyclobacillus sp. SO9 TaxID=2665646 RepID=UPI0018E8B5A9|nr:hypothetical protein [Alicyclobacillus sp. SO9]QQE78895.1 hypothetical protein GI364_24200 [Alicyclobacillus sp. SO9]
MFDAFNDELGQLKEQIRIRDRKQSKLKACQLQLDEARRHVSNLREGLSDKQHVPDKLHGLSFLHLMVLIKGIEDTKEEQIHREAVQLNGKLTTAVGLVERLEADEFQLQRDLKLTGGIEQQYQNILREKEQAIASEENSLLAQRLLEYTHKEADLNAEVQETEEVLAAAQDAKAALKDCLESLRKAQNWGTMDMLGGGTITTMIKRSHMDSAQSKMDNASYALSRLQRELQDLDENVSNPVDIHQGGFMHFADYFFDGLFVDWAVQNHIKQTASQVDEQYQQVDGLVTAVQARLVTLKQQVAGLKRERKQLVEKA